VNSRLDPLQAAILAVKLRHLDRWNAARARIAALYLDALGGSGLVLPHVPNWAEPVWHLFVLQVEDREGLTRALEAGGVQTLVHYPIAPHRQQAYAELGYGAGSFPIAERLAHQVLSLPIGPHMEHGDAQRVVEIARTWASPRG
jgi:dTDP-4-amino-4,6-dideoxygalactose transaminase